MNKNDLQSKRIVLSVVRIAMIFSILSSCIFIGCKNGLEVPKDTNTTVPASGLIEDPLLLKVVNKTIDKNRNGDEAVTKAELEQITELSIFVDKDGKPDFNEDAEGSILGVPTSLKGTKDFKFAVTRGIKSIKGLEYCTNLTKLKLNENEISDLSPLKNLTKLAYLEMSRNRIVDLTPIENLTELTYLKLYNNLIENITPIENLTKLTYLDLHYNTTVAGDENNKIISKGITDISALKNLKGLTFLDISANRISDVKTILNFEKITDLDFSGNNVTDYTGLEEYIIERYVKMNDEENPIGSINFYSQTAAISEPITLNNKQAVFASPFTGIEAFSKKLGEAFDNEGIHIFRDADLKEIKIDKQELTGSTFDYDEKTKQFTISFADAACTQYKNTTQQIRITVSCSEMPWYIIIPVRFGK